MKKINNFLLLLSLLFTISIFTTGCGTDKMDGINIVVTNYTNEYIVDRLYKDHATISTVYPDGVNTSTYKVTKKQKKEYSKCDIFVYNGAINNERELAVELSDINPSLKIIDSAYVLESDVVEKSYEPEALWLRPSSLLMMSRNVKNGLEEYISSTYLRKEIQDNYDQLNIDISELEVRYSDAANDANNKKIVVDNKILEYLEQFKLEVYNIDSDASEKTLADVDNLFNEKKVSYIITFNDTELSKNAKAIQEKYSNVKIIKLHKLDNIKDNERTDKKDYLSIMDNNLSLLNQELYQ